MNKSFLAAAMLTISFGFAGAPASAVTFTSATECAAGSVWDAKDAKCDECSKLVTDAELLKTCQACEAGTAFDIGGGSCEKVIVKAPN